MLVLGFKVLPMCLGYRLGGQPFYVLVAVHVKRYCTKPSLLGSSLERLCPRQQNQKIDTTS